MAASQYYGYPLPRIFNMGETPMQFKMPPNHILKFSGSHTVPMKSCSAEKRSFTVTLAVAADGKKLPPKVTFKGIQTLETWLFQTQFVFHSTKKDGGMKLIS